MFGKCPVNGSRNSAGCLKMQKSYFDMSRTELEEVTEKIYKEELPSPIWNQSVVPCPVLTVAS